MDRQIRFGNVGDISEIWRMCFRNLLIPSFLATMASLNQECIRVRIILLTIVKDIVADEAVIFRKISEIGGEENPTGGQITRSIGGRHTRRLGNGLATGKGHGMQIVDANR